MNAAAILAALARHGVAPRSLCLDSRRVQPGDVFVAAPGAHVDGRAYIAQAVSQGAVAVIAEAGAVPPGLTVPLVEVSGLAQQLGELAHHVYGRPSERLWLVGVTGTNGKTSVTQWIAQAVAFHGERCALIGTLGNGFPGALVESPNTTPDAVTLHRDFADFLAQGATACAMEVSSIGLDQGRVGGAAIDVAVFTNLTRDHLEYHGDMDSYGAAKEKLFLWPGLRAAVINLDDPFGVYLARRLAGHVRTIGYTLADAGGTDEVLRAEHLRFAADGMEFSLHGLHVATRLVGRFNAANLLAVAGALLARGAALPDIVAALTRLTPPPGRMQALGGAGQPLVVIDYAHTPDALEKALGVLRETAAARGGQLICVFGCGGDRDPGKRPLMGAVVERLADQVVVTSDNPRSEDPLAIVAAIRGGMRRAPRVEIDRALAVAGSIAAAAAADVILLAGKGHEPYQEVAGVRIPYSDLATAERALAERAA